MNFKRIYIEITNNCNLNCSFCLPHQREAKFMTVDEFEYILNHISPFTKFIYLHIKGEPLLHPQLDQLLEKTKEYQIQVNLTTNGTLLPQKEKILLSSPSLRQVNISLHSHTEHTTTDYFKNIIRFAKQARDTRRLYTSIRLWNLPTTGNINQETNEIIQQLEHEFAIPFSILDNIQKGQSVQLAERVFLSTEEQFEWPSLSNPFYGTEGTCYGLRSQLGILVDGTVVPCCLDTNGDIALGNIFNQSLDSILNYSYTQQIQKGFQERKVIAPLCQHCSFKNRF